MLKQQKITSGSTPVSPKSETEATTAQVHLNYTVLDLNVFSFCFGFFFLPIFFFLLMFTIFDSFSFFPFLHLPFLLAKLTSVKLYFMLAVYNVVLFSGAWI